jgi:hypothetical protein
MLEGRFATRDVAGQLGRAILDVIELFLKSVEPKRLLRARRMGHDKARDARDGAEDGGAAQAGESDTAPIHPLFRGGQRSSALHRGHGPLCLFVDGHEAPWGDALDDFWSDTDARMRNRMFSPLVGYRNGMWNFPN